MWVRGRCLTYSQGKGCLGAAVAGSGGPIGEYAAVLRSVLFIMHTPPCTTHLSKSKWTKFKWADSRNRFQFLRRRKPFNWNVSSIIQEVQSISSFQGFVDLRVQLILRVRRFN